MSRRAIVGQWLSGAAHDAVLGIARVGDSGNGPPLLMATHAIIGGLRLTIAIAQATTRLKLGCVNKG
ncbi:MAG: hypothetical protein ABSF46_06065 [Terriglobia bacterium]